MFYLRFSNEQAKKGTGRAILFALMLGLIFAISSAVIYSRSLNKYKQDFKQIIKETGCHIVANQLVCEKNYYGYDNFIIDLDLSEPKEGNRDVILTRDHLYVVNQKHSYKSLLETMSQKADLSGDELVNVFESLISSLIVLTFVVLLFVGVLFYIIGNFVLAGVMVLLIRLTLGKEIGYKNMYKLTLYTAFPYVLFNGLTRIILSDTLSSYLSRFLYFNILIVLFRVIIDYAIIFGLTYLTLKKCDDNEADSDVYTVDETISGELS